LCRSRQRTRFFVFTLAAALTAGHAASAHQPARPENTRDVLLANWNEIGEKVVKLAEEFPEGKYDYKPVDGVRTFADVLRYVAFWNEYVAKAARGEWFELRQLRHGVRLAAAAAAHGDARLTLRAGGVRLNGVRDALSALRHV
jgi:hypothetical protein